MSDRFGTRLGFEAVGWRFWFYQSLYNSIADRVTKNIRASCTPLVGNDDGAAK